MTFEYARKKKFKKSVLKKSQSVTWLGGVFGRFGFSTAFTFLFRLLLLEFYYIQLGLSFIYKEKNFWKSLNVFTPHKLICVWSIYW